MNKINLVLSTLALAAVGGRAVAQTANAGAEDQRPNILYIMCDDHAMQCISAYGSAISKQHASLRQSVDIGRRCQL